MKISRRSAMGGFAASFAAGFGRPVRAQQNWPDKPLRIMVGTAPGGSPDIISRMLGDKMAQKLGQSVYIENNAGGGGSVALQTVTRSPPDGTNLTMMTAGYSTGVAVQKFTYDPQNSFSFVSMVCAYPMVYSVAAHSPIKTFADLLARAKANPGKISYVITSAGSVYHLVGKWVDMAAGTDMLPVSYRGTAAGVADVLADRVEVMLDTATSSFPRIRSGQFRVLAVTSPERYPLMPEAPTVAEHLPGVHYMSWLGLAAAPHTPRPIIDRLNAETRRALELPDVKAKLNEGGNIPTPTSPEAMAKQIEDEIANWKRIVEANNIKVE
jgi:tripartite-type tricarboxylate transporter receptor subunit TctC